MIRFITSRNKPLKPLTRQHMTTGTRPGTTGGTGVVEHSRRQGVTHGLTGEPAGK